MILRSDVRECHRLNQRLLQIPLLQIAGPAAPWVLRQAGAAPAQHDRLIAHEHDGRDIRLLHELLSTSKAF